MIRRLKTIYNLLNYNFIYKIYLLLTLVLVAGCTSIYYEQKPSNSTLDSCTKDEDCVLVMSGCPQCPKCDDYKLSDPEIIPVNKHLYKCPSPPEDLICPACASSIDYDPQKAVACVNSKCVKKFQ